MDESESLTEGGQKVVVQSPGKEEVQSHAAISINGIGVPPACGSVLVQWGLMGVWGVGGYIR